MLKEIQRAIILCSSVAVVFPLLLALKNFKNFPADLKAISWYLINATVFSTIALSLWLTQKNNLPLLHLYTITEFVCISYFYYFVFTAKNQRKTIGIITALFCSFSVLNVFFIQDLHTFNTIPRSIESIVLIVYALLCFQQQLKQLNFTRLEYSWLFWVNTGFLIYFSSALLLFTLSNYILPLNHQLNMYIWILHALFSVLQYFLIFIGLWQHR